MALPFLAVSDAETQFLDGVRCRYRSFAQCYLTSSQRRFACSLVGSRRRYRVMSKSFLPERDRKRAALPSGSEPKLARGTRDIAPATIKVARGTRDMAPLDADGDDDTIVVDADSALGDLSLDSEVGDTS